MKFVQNMEVISISSGKNIKIYVACSTRVANLYTCTREEDTTRVHARVHVTRDHPYLMSLITNEGI